MRLQRFLQNEHNELLGLTDLLDQAEADRAESLVQLARLRGVSMTELMQNLGIQAAGSGKTETPCSDTCIRLL